jgi:hypothetical protein
MDALSARGNSLPFLRCDERPEVPAWLPETVEYRMAARNAEDALPAYLGLCESLEKFALLRDGSRHGAELRLPLAYGPFSLILDGRITQEFLSSQVGEAQRHLRAEFELPGGWRLLWHLQAGLHLADSSVRLVSRTWIEAGVRRSFRHIIAARALRRAVTTAVARRQGKVGANQGRES